ncbi:MAG TPA: caspase family protein [Nitrososphaeraceae archaeon]
MTAVPNDAEALSQILEDPSIGDFEVKRLLNESSYNLNQEIEIFFNERQRCDILLLYFSGHGLSFQVVLLT